MRKIWYDKSITNLETCWHNFKDWRFAATITSHGCCDPAGTTFHISFIFFSIWFGIKWQRKRNNKDYCDYEYGIDIYKIDSDYIICWRWGQDRDSWSSGTPWYRYSYINIKDYLFGRYIGDCKEIDRLEDVWIDPMDGTEYRAVYRLVKHEQYRSKFKLIKRVFHRMEIDLDEDEKGIGVPIPGKGTCSWNCGDSSISSSSIGIGDDPVPDNWIDETRNRFTNNVIKTRLEYGGKQWKPQSAA